ncbi:non-specific lipid-transfer protein, partial [Elysia marginata]
PTSDGSACAILASEQFVRKHKLEAQAIEIAALEMSTDEPSVFGEENIMKVVGYDMAKTTAKRAFRKAGMTPDDVQVVELHDCFAANELITYESLGLCPEGLAQCSELVWQLRGQAQKRQVPYVKACLQHNLGLGGAVVIGLYKHGFPEAARRLQQNLTAKL